MAQIAMIAGLGVMCLSSSVGAALMMGGGEEDGGADSSGGGANDQDDEDNTPEPDFIIHETGDRIFGDLTYTADQTLEQCQALCKANDDCVGISYNSTTKGCWQKGTTGGGSGATGNLRDYNTPSDYQFHYKNVPGYEVKDAGDRVQGDIEGMPVTETTLVGCANVCDSKTNCVGFSYNSHGNVCYAKKAEGLNANYAINGYQFYDKKA